MATISRVNIAGQEKTLFNKLETTTYERTYRKAYIENQKTDFVGTCKKCWNTFWLHTFGRNGYSWHGIKIAGADTLKAERVAIKEYTTQRDTLITELAKTPIKFNHWADLMGGTPEPLTSEKDPKNARLRQARHVENTLIPAFYTALRGRVESLNETTTDQAKLYNAGFAQLVVKAHEHNKIKGAAFLDPVFVDHVVESSIKEKALNELASTISFEDLTTKGLGAIATALELHIKTFGAYAGEEVLAQLKSHIEDFGPCKNEQALADLTKLISVKVLAKQLFEKVVELHGEKCLEEVAIRQNPAYAEEEALKLRPKLEAQLEDAQSRMQAHLQVIKRMPAPEQELLIRNEITTILDKLAAMPKVTERQKQKLETELENAQSKMDAHTTAHPPKKLKPAEQMRVLEKTYKAAQKEQRIRNEITNILQQLNNYSGAVENQVEQEIEFLQTFIPRFNRSEDVAQDIVNLLPTDATEEPLAQHHRVILNHFGDEFAPRGGRALHKRADRSPEAVDTVGHYVSMPALAEYEARYANGKAMTRAHVDTIVDSYKKKHENGKRLKSVANPKKKGSSANSNRPLTKEAIEDFLLGGPQPDGFSETRPHRVGKRADLAGYGLLDSD